MTPCVEDYLSLLSEEISKWHNEHIKGFNTAKGSSHNHQNWEGGYADHLLQCFCLADKFYDHITELWGKLPFTLESVLKVLYFHDVEKLFRYGMGVEIDKEEYLYKTLAERYSITFTEEESNALRYIHGEETDYRKNQRVMNELAGFCHAIDIFSARVLHDKGEPTG